MTRSNLNFVWQNPGEAPRTLFHYHNGDQYPEGLLQFFGLDEFLAVDHVWTPDDFRSWIRKNYRQACRQVTTLANGLTIDAHAESEKPAEPEDLGEGGQPRIFYTDGFTTDYSYVFTIGTRWKKLKDGRSISVPENRVIAWSWNKLIFDGAASGFLRFCEKRVKPAIIPAEAKMFSAVAAGFGLPA